MEYIIINDISLSDFQRKVTEKLNQGFVISGSMVIDNGMFYQPMADYVRKTGTTRV